MRLATKVFTASALSIIAISATACGSSSSGTSGTSGSSGTSGASSGASLTATALSTAKKDLAPYSGKVSEFPVDQPLAKKPAAGTTFAYLQCSTAICALQGQLLSSITKSLGVGLVTAKAGPSAQQEQQAADSLIAKKPSVFILPGTDPVAIRPEMQQLQSAGVPVVALGVTDSDQFPAVKATIQGKQFMLLAGKLFADWAVVTNGTAPSVFYNTPELAFSPLMTQAYQDQMKTLCRGCEVRVVNIPQAAIGSTAPTAVVNDLRAHPETKTAVFAAEDAVGGLPAALKVAGIQGVAINGYAPGPSTLAYIQSGEITAGLAVDAGVIGFLNVDIALRLAGGQSLTPDEKAGLSSTEMVTKNDLAGKDVSKGFIAYPDAPQRFMKLWAASDS